MALALKKFSFILTQVSLRDCASSSFRGLFIRGLPVYTVSNSTTKGNDSQQEQNDDFQEKKEKTKEDQVFSASMVVRSRRPTPAPAPARRPKPPPPSEGRGGQHN